MAGPDTIYLTDRKQWREWLEEHFDKRREVWLVFPKISSGLRRIPYNDAVEEALCFGWIDSTIRRLDEDRVAQRFSPRSPKSAYSQANKERLRWLAKEGLLHPSVRDSVEGVLKERFVFPDDIVRAIKRDEAAWKNYQGLSPSYKRIRVAYIDGARKRPGEFEKRLRNFIEKTREGKTIGYGGIEKYY